MTKLIPPISMKGMNVKFMSMKKKMRHIIDYILLDSSLKSSMYWHKNIKKGIITLFIRSVIDVAK